MNLTVRLERFYSQNDEDRFFAALKTHRAVRGVQGVGRDLIVDLDVRRLHRESLLDLVGLLYRYGLALRPLRSLADHPRFAWLRDRKKYWYRHMFLGSVASTSPEGQLETLYTIVMEYRGGTYVSQVTARNVFGALRAWAVALNVDAVAGLGPRRKAELIDQIEDQLAAPVALDGVINGWCASAVTSGGLVLVNIIETAPR